MENTVHIALSSDDNFVVPMSVLISRILYLNNETHTKYVFHILHYKNSLSQNSIDKLTVYFSGSCCVLDFVDTYPIFSKYQNAIDKMFYSLENPSKGREISIAAYNRLLIPYLFKDVCRNICYLDIDTFFIRNVNFDELFSKLNGKPIAAVNEIIPENREYMLSYLTVFVGTLNLPKSQINEYFNSGVLLFDTKLFCEMFSMEDIIRNIVKCCETLVKDASRGTLWDQDVLNVLCFNNFSSIENIYNRQLGFIESFDWDLDKIMNTAYIFHYSGECKPWKRYLDNNMNMFDKAYIDFALTNKMFAEKYVTTRTNNYGIIRSKLTDDISIRIWDSIQYQDLQEEQYIRLKEISRNRLQYFDVFLLKTNEVFVDCGGYIGDTVDNFIKWTGGSFGRIYSFEAIPDYYMQYSDKNSDKIRVFNNAVYSNNSVVDFIKDEQKSKIVCVGSVKVKSVTIDSIIPENEIVTFIKMDIEGSEQEALRGAAQTILKNKPRLAISIYHNYSDIIDIPTYLLSLVPEYVFKIRHYSHCSSETILYAYRKESVYE
jgi:FkbM family methyltransferase